MLFSQALLPKALIPCLPERLNLPGGLPWASCRLADLADADFCIGLGAQQRETIWSLVAKIIARKVRLEDFPTNPMALLGSLCDDDLDELCITMQSLAGHRQIGRDVLRTASLSSITRWLRKPDVICQFLIEAEELTSAAPETTPRDSDKDDWEVGLEDLKLFASSTHAKSVKTSDLRFGMVLRAARMHTSLKHDATFSEILDALLERADFLSGVARAMVDQLRLLAGDLQTAAEYSVSREIQDISLYLANLIAGRERSDIHQTALVFGMRYGLLGDQNVNYDSIGQRLGFTGKNASKIIDRMVSASGNRTVYAPACDCLRREIEARVPCSHEELERQLHGFLGPGLSLSSAFRFMWDFLGAPRDVNFLPIASKSPAPPKIVSIGGQGAVWRHVNNIAVQLVTQLGAAQTHWVAAKAGEATEIAASAAEVAAVLSARDDFEWLSESAGWFWFGPHDTKNRAILSIRKIHAVAKGPVSPDDILSAIARGRNDNLPLADAIGMPLSVLRAMLSRITPKGRPERPGRVTDVSDPSGTLSDSECKLYRLFYSGGGVLAYAEAFEQLVATGSMKEVTLNKSLSHSPIFNRISPGIYRLTGWPIASDDLRRAERACQLAKTRKPSQASA